MIYAKLNDSTYALRFDAGDDIIGQLQSFCKEQEVVNAQLTGLGSVESPRLAHYSLHTRRFTEVQLEGSYEITAFSGNVGLIDDQPVPHVHVALANEHMQAFGGHLMAGHCGATLELIITAYPTRYRKTYSEACGLNVWNFEL